MAIMTMRQFAAPEAGDALVSGYKVRRAVKERGELINEHRSGIKNRLDFEFNQPAAPNSELDPERRIRECEPKACQCRAEHELVRKRHAFGVASLLSPSHQYNHPRSHSFLRHR